MSERNDAIRDALRAEGRRRNVSTDLILCRWVAERFLYRLSRSAYADRLTLKGAFLFAAWEGDLLRATSDVDLHAPADDIDVLGPIVREIATCTPDTEDGVRFDPTSLTAIPLIGSRIPGRRITVAAAVGSARLRLKIDVSFGQPIRPGAETRQYPSLMPGFPSFPVRTYPRETVVGEKLAVAVEYGRDNTRLRDYWDLWFISSRYRFTGHVLTDSVAATFADRDAGGFILRNDGYWEGAFDYAFVDHRTTRAWTDWIARHTPVAGQPTFHEAVAAVSRFATPLLCAIREGRDLRGRWSFRHGWSGNKRESVGATNFVDRGNSL